MHCICLHQTFCCAASSVPTRILLLRQRLYKEQADHDQQLQTRAFLNVPEMCSSSPGLTGPVTTCLMPVYFKEYFYRQTLYTCFA